MRNNALSSLECNRNTSDWTLDCDFRSCRQGIELSKSHVSFEKLIRCGFNNKFLLFKEKLAEKDVFLMQCKTVEMK